MGESIKQKSLPTILCDNINDCKSVEIKLRGLVPSSEIKFKLDSNISTIFVFSEKQPYTAIYVVSTCGLKFYFCLIKYSFVPK